PTGGGGASTHAPAPTSASSRPAARPRPGGGRPGSSSQRSHERHSSIVREKPPTGPVAIPPQIVVRDLAELLHSTPTEIIRHLIKHHIFASINQVVDYEQAALVARDLGFEPTPQVISPTSASLQRGALPTSAVLEAARDDKDTVPIPPVVTIMGHVDHGKTTLLDMIRKTRVAAEEAGGITQHIGAYQVEVKGKKITFLDTPGHEAFTAMRARGAQVTHIAVIVVAADDGVMPQTREAIDHARAANVPIIIAINKIDKPTANPELVKQQLAEIGVIVEDYGGDTVCVPISARTGAGIDELLEMILLVAEMQDLRANPNRPAVGVVIEAKLEKSTGPMATVLVQEGTLKMGDHIVVGPLAGKVRAMFNDRGKRIQKAPPSTPVSILGLPEVPQPGDRLEVVPDERTAKQRAAEIAEQRRAESSLPGHVSLDTLYMQMQEGKTKELNIVLKGDVQGTVEAIKNALLKLGEEKIKLHLIHEGVGNITETDVHLAAASGAIIIGFNVKADNAALRQAQKEGVEIRYYDVIYQLVEDIEAALKGLLEPTYHEVVEGHAEVLQLFRSGKNTVIAGCRVTDGKITRTSQVRVLRNGTKVHESRVASLRRGKDDVREVAAGYECGMIIEGFSNVQVGDIIEAFRQEKD
ncbi:MAG: translation initiation factor IF-2, partial [Thermogemmatispora sp.]|uniref:translation initiation factor IF-2 n=1 Tax=Thermogemmatispora sp. TaxID=1968838 RepID=UPI00261B886D